MSTVGNPIEETTTVLNGVPAAEIRSQLDLILRSRAFIQSHRIRRFLQFVVEESLLGQPHRLKEYLIGLEVFDRREAFDPRVDSIVRVEARRLRYKLDEYYRTEGREDGIRIVLRKGSYVPIFEYRSAANGVSPLSPRAQHGNRALLSDQRDLGTAAAEAGAAADEIQRRLAHVLIKEGCFQVVVKSQVRRQSAKRRPMGLLHAGSEHCASAAPLTTWSKAAWSSRTTVSVFLLQLQQGVGWFLHLVRDHGWPAAGSVLYRSFGAAIGARSGGSRERRGGRAPAIGAQGKLRCLSAGPVPLETGHAG